MNYLKSPDNISLNSRSASPTFRLQNPHTSIFHPKKSCRLETLIPCLIAYIFLQLLFLWLVLLNSEDQKPFVVLVAAGHYYGHKKPAKSRCRKTVSVKVLDKNTNTPAPFFVPPEFLFFRKTLLATCTRTKPHVFFLLCVPTFYLLRVGLKYYSLEIACSSL
jgi:hypothetical protein